jgi:hypothetical protein
MFTPAKNFGVGPRCGALRASSNMASKEPPDSNNDPKNPTRTRDVKLGSKTNTVELPRMVETKQSSISICSGGMNKV